MRLELAAVLHGQRLVAEIAVLCQRSDLAEREIQLSDPAARGVHGQHREHVAVALLAAANVDEHATKGVDLGIVERAISSPVVADERDIAKDPARKLDVLL